MRVEKTVACKCSLFNSWHWSLEYVCKQVGNAYNMCITAAYKTLSHNWQFLSNLIEEVNRNRVKTFELMLINYSSFADLPRASVRISSASIGNNGETSTNGTNSGEGWGTWKTALQPSYQPTDKPSWITQYLQDGPWWKAYCSGTT